MRSRAAFWTARTAIARTVTRRFYLLLYPEESADPSRLVSDNAGSNTEQTNRQQKCCMSVNWTTRVIFAIPFPFPLSRRTHACAPMKASSAGRATRFLPLPAENGREARGGKSLHTPRHHLQPKKPCHGPAACGVGCCSGALELQWWDLLEGKDGRDWRFAVGRRRALLCCGGEGMGGFSGVGRTNGSCRGVMTKKWSVSEPEPVRLISL